MIGILGIHNSDDITYISGNFQDNVNHYWDGRTDVSIIGNRAYNQGGHAVLVVGWDDNYSKDNFGKSGLHLVPPKDGAFLVKNSWGNMNNLGGYCWYSYYDATFAKKGKVVIQGGERDYTSEVYSFRSCESVDSYTGVYGHDPLGKVLDFGKGSESCYGASVFVARKRETLSAVGLYANALNTSYEISIYKGCKESQPTSGDLVSRCSGSLDAGYFTVQLATPVTVNEGDRFAVVVKLTTQGYESPLSCEVQSYTYDYLRDSSGLYYYSGGALYSTDKNGVQTYIGDLFVAENNKKYLHYLDGSILEFRKVARFHSLRFKLRLKGSE